MRTVRSWQPPAVVLALLASAAVAAVSAFAAVNWASPLEGVVHDAARSPDGWADVNVGRGVVSVPPDWAVIDERELSHEEQRQCPEITGPSLWIRTHANAGLWFDCDRRVLDLAVQIAAMGRNVGGLSPSSPGEPDVLGAVAAWRSDPQPVHAVPPDGTEDHGPAFTSWVAPAVDLWAAVPETLDDPGVLVTVRPSGRVDVSAVLLTTDHRLDPWPDTEIRYAVVDARGRRTVWFTEPHDGMVSAGMAGTRHDWPALDVDRLAVIDVAQPGSVRIVAGSPEGGAVVWEEGDAFDGLTLGSHPQVAWLPDGAGVVWYAARENPLIGVVRWRDADAIAAGAPPVQEETVDVSSGPVQIDPTVLSVHQEGSRLRLHFFRGTPAPYDPRMPWDEQVSHPWELDLTVRQDGEIVIPRPVVLLPAEPLEDE
jgi:hypothetical protein